MHYIMTDLKCFSGTHLFSALLSYVILILFSLMTATICVLLFESRNNANPTAQINARIDLLFFFTKICYIVAFVFFRNDEYILFKASILLLCSFFTFLNLCQKMPFIDPVNQTLHEILSGLFVWTNLNLVIAYAMRDAMYSGALLIYVFGAPVVAVLIYFRPGKNYWNLLVAYDTQINSAEYC